jgi:uncharacterized protein with HEPN domain
VRDDREWLADIYEAITNMEKYALRGRDAFLQEELIQVWMRNHFQILGEAARNISGHFKEEHSGIFTLVPKLHLGTPGGAQAQLGNE